MFEQKFTSLVEGIKTQFNYRVVGTGIHIKEDTSLKIIENKTNIILDFINKDKNYPVNIPKPFIDKGVSLIESAKILRPTCLYLHEQTQKQFDYVDCIYEILLGNTSMIIPKNIYPNATSVMQYIKYGYDNDSLEFTIYKIQKLIDYVVHNLPLHTTYMKSWVINRKIHIIDNYFDIITSPEEKHIYQVEKNKKYFDRGWSSLGLSDGSLANHNYILTTDLRKLTPFGVNFHNPQRNLYSTLEMKGDETPILYSQTASELAKEGLTRSGWNLFTMFVDIPDVWEDQLMVDIRHKNKFIEYSKKIISYGEVLVNKGDLLYDGDKISVNTTGEIQYLNLKCDEAVVEDLVSNEIVSGGLKFKITEIILKYKRCFTDGTKITNTAANKGVIKMRDLGYAIHPVTGEKVKIDVIVSAKAVLKRKNYSQILEALFNTLNDNKPAIVSDDVVITEESIKKALKLKGFEEEGVWKCKTYAGDLKGICGKVFWGVTHDAQDTVWDKEEITAKNNRNIINAGLKISTVEFSALAKRFGEDNPITKEIITHAQGQDDFKEEFKIMSSQLGNINPTTPIINVEDIKSTKSTGSLFTKEQLKGTIVDKSFMSEGFILKLPVKYQIMLSEDNSVIFEGLPIEDVDNINGVKIKSKIIIDKLYVPWYNLRKCWKHPSGLYGLSEFSLYIDNIIQLSHKYISSDIDDITLTHLYQAIKKYFSRVATKVGSKRGELSVYNLSVRYPYSAKAVATLSNNLQPNTIEIHSSMARDLGIKTGEIVLVERFPCLGFMSIRPQRVIITNDEFCKYTIRVSGNSLGSLTLDFDGDVIYIATFKTKEARKLLRKEWKNPNKLCYNYIKHFNAKMGKPRFKEIVLSEYNITQFKPLTKDTHATIVDKLTGVKSYTGPVVALAYNIFRKAERASFEERNVVKACCAKY
jgi:hypothetical protein